MNDLVFVKDLNLYTCIGYTEAERAFPQKLLANLECGVKAFKRGLALEDTICYDTISTLFIEITNENTWILLEDLALELALGAFTKFSNLTSIKIKIDKFIVPNPASTGIEIRRERKDFEL